MVRPTGAVQQALSAAEGERGRRDRPRAHGGHFIGPKAAAEPRSILRELRTRFAAAATALRAAESLLCELDGYGGFLDVAVPCARGGSVERRAVCRPRRHVHPSERSVGWKAQSGSDAIALGCHSRTARSNGERIRSAGALSSAAGGPSVPFGFVA